MISDFQNSPFSKMSESVLRETFRVYDIDGRYKIIVPISRISVKNIDLIKEYVDKFQDIFWDYTKKDQPVNEESLQAIPLPFVDTAILRL